MNNKEYHIENILKLIFLIFSILPLKSGLLNIITIVVGIIVSVMALTRQIGKVQLSVSYLQQAINKEFGLNIFYLLVTLGIKHSSFLFFSPIFTQYFLGQVQYVQIWNQLRFKNLSVERVIGIIMSKKNLVKSFRTYLELVLLLYSIAMIRSISYFLPISLYYYLRLKISKIPGTINDVNKLQQIVLSFTDRFLSAPAITRGINFVFDKLKSIK